MREFELLGQNFGLVRGKVSLQPLVNKGGGNGNWGFREISGEFPKLGGLGVQGG